MRTARFGGSFAVVVLFAACASPGFGAVTSFDTVMRRLAAPAGFRAHDFDLLVNYRAPVPKSLPAVEAMLREPGGFDRTVPGLRGDLGGGSSSSFWKWLGVRPFGTVWRIRPSTTSFARAADEAVRAYGASLAQAEIRYLTREAPPLFRADAEDTTRTPIEIEIERRRMEAVTDSVMKLADGLPREKLAEAAWWLERLEEDLRSEENPDALGRKLDTLRKAGIPVRLGGPGNDVHRLDRGIVFDPGGDDRYEFPDSARPGIWLLVIDVSGNDTYLARDSVGGAAAFLSVQVVADLKGNDRYIGGDFAFGAALLGYSRLYDAVGDDVYEARCASLGFAFQGIGILEDAAGNDTYSTAYFSQGAAGPNGLGLLLDHAGDDRYVSRPVYPDDLRYRDHFLSMSQGFSSGFAPRHAGGLGILWDREGNDSYQADIFAQGTGYWFAWGLLMDDSGNDRFNAYQYAQGAGVHFAVGALLDEAGDDVRVSKGVSQGCGHDGAFGLLLDVAGNDSTTAVDMSAGAGSANGLGIYLDLSGDDVYKMGNPSMTLGHGDMRRDRGSFGFFLDLGGKDAYPDSGGIGEKRTWRAYDGQKRGEGYGVDAE